MSARVVTSVDQMRQIGETLGTHLRAGDIIVLHGGLGAGKTAFTQGLGRSLGFFDVTSPTFVISRIHEGALPLIHVDAYRLLGAGQNFEFDDIDLDTVRERAVTVIEWGGDVALRLREDFLRVSIEFGKTDDERILTITAVGKRWQGFHL